MAEARIRTFQVENPMYGIVVEGQLKTAGIPFHRDPHQTLVVGPGVTQSVDGEWTVFRTAEWKPAPPRAK